MDLEYLRNKIIKLVEEKGHPRELGALVADNLGSENTMIRMIETGQSLRLTLAAYGLGCALAASMTVLVYCELLGG